MRLSTIKRKKVIDKRIRLGGGGPHVARKIYDVIIERTKGRTIPVGRVIDEAFQESILYRKLKSKRKGN